MSAYLFIALTFTIMLNLLYSPTHVVWIKMCIFANRQSVLYLNKIHYNKLKES